MLHNSSSHLLLHLLFRHHRFFRFFPFSSAIGMTKVSILSVTYPAHNRDGRADRRITDQFTLMSYFTVHAAGPPLANWIEYVIDVFGRPAGRSSA